MALTSIGLRSWRGGLGRPGAHADRPPHPEHPEHPRALATRPGERRPGRWL